jgi:methylglutaconyl-CoA hydratase
MANEILDNLHTVVIAHTGPVARVWMNRPAVHNALNELMIAELTHAFLALGIDNDVRVIVLSGRGKSFCSGADADDMKRQGSASSDENLADARKLADLFRTIAASPKPTVARINGAAIGGGLGLVAACDIAIAATATVFATSEVRLGLIPSTIAPYVVRAIGPRQSSRLFLTGERITAARAATIGLVQEAVDPDQLDAQVETVINHLLIGAPQAQTAAKGLIELIANQSITTQLIEQTAQSIASIRSRPEASEGLTAFLEKRPAAWVPPA